MNPIRTLSRRLAAVLAAAALVSAAARPVLACGMGQPAEAEHGTAAAAPASLAQHAGHGVHQDHAMPADGAHADMTHTAPASSAPASDVPGSHAPACDHLVGCAVMIVAAAPATATVPVAVPEAAVRAIDAAIDAPTIPLETPPPRA